MQRCVPGQPDSWFQIFRIATHGKIDEPSARLDDDIVSYQEASLSISVTD